MSFCLYKYIKTQWPLMTMRALLFFGLVLVLFGLSSQVVPAPLASASANASASALAVSVSFAVPAAKSPVAEKQAQQAKPTDAAVNMTEPSATKALIAENKPVIKPEPKPEVKPVSPQKPLAEPERPIETEPAEAVLTASEPTDAVPTEAVPTKATPAHKTPTEPALAAVEPPLESDDVSEPSTPALAAAAQADGAHQEPEFVQPLFAAPPTPPRYPTVARKRGREGVVLIDIWLDAEGKQAKREIAQSSGWNVLDESALKAVARWQFHPHQAAGVNIASRLRVPVEFSLQ
ncbi:energy transducer TonB [Corallincola spongiicola]|uniref:Protein TonB n=1 Tax=Corallincola spongiicola TaxID=2520508 RepID=A0ABY1WLE5_9GAMM|nr:energy transducer TonB [Corallincola spongiicola]TAA41742.1 energy transducer TonB [Corallincola spongiicola]